MRFFGTLVFGTVLAGAGLVYYVHERSAGTGESYLEVLKQLPSEVGRSVDEARRRAVLALEDGFAAARRRADEVERELLAVAPVSRS